MVQFTAKLTKNDNEATKDKVVKFPIFDGVSILSLMKLGYQRRDVEQLFEHMESIGLGKYVRGARGKGNVSHFLTAPHCPKEYVMTFKVKLLHGNYVGCPEELKKPTAAAPLPSIINEKIEKIKSIPHSPLYMPHNLGTGYLCSYTDEYIIIDRVTNKGYNTIESALNTVWDDIKHKITIKATRNMTEKDQVISKLKAFNYYKFDIIQQNDEQKLENVGGN